MQIKIVMIENKSRKMFCSRKEGEKNELVKKYRGRLENKIKIFIR